MLLPNSFGQSVQDEKGEGRGGGNTVRLQHEVKQQKQSVCLDLNFSPHIRDCNKAEGHQLMSPVEGQPEPCP